MTINCCYFKNMKISLLAVPHTHPTCPPLGPAVLSSYLQENVADISVSVFDLSLDYYLSSFAKMKEGSLGIRLYKWDEKTTAANIEQAVSFLRRWHPVQGELKEYNHWATLFLSFETVFNAFMADMAERALYDQPVPKAIENFFAELLQPVLAEDPNLIGLSVLYQQQLVFAALFAKMLKQQSDAKIVVGGATLSVMHAPETLLVNPLAPKTEDRPEIFCRDLFDYLIAGEGELALQRLCLAETAEDLRHVPNLIYFDDGRLRINAPDSADIELFPFPDFSRFRLNDYLTPEPVLPLMTSRGCPWAKCSFCTHHHSYLRYRTRKIEDCVAEIKFLQERYACNLFYFYDEMIPPRRFRKLAETLISENIEIHYGAYAKPVKSFDDELCSILKHSGCRVLQWGVESASQRVLDLMCKGTSIDDVQQVLHCASRAGIFNLVFVLFGFPSETLAEMEETIRFLERNRDDIHAMSSGTFVMAEGSLVQSEPERFSIRAICEQPQSSLLYPALDYETSRGMTPQEVRQHYNGQQKFFNEIPLSPRFGTYREHLLLYGAGNDGEEAATGKE